MAATVQSLIPAPLTGITFLKASHFRTGFDLRPQGNVVESPYRTDFPPLWGCYKPVPILPPNSKGVLNQDMVKARENWSETQQAFPVRSLELMPRICPPESHLRKHADSKTNIFTSVARESYPWPDMTLQGPVPQKADYNKEGDHFPCGDKDKLKLLPSVYHASYPVYEQLQPISKAPCIHLGGIPTIKGDRCSYYGTSYQAQFEGGWTPPVKLSGKSKSSIVFGDPRSMIRTSEEKHAYTVQDMKNHSAYDREHAAFQIHKTNIKPGDGRTRFHTAMLESFPLRELASKKAMCANKQSSSVPRVDQGLKSCQECATTTTSRFFHTQIDMRDHPPQPDVTLWRRQSSVPMGDKHFNSCFFSTTQHLDYQPPPKSQHEMASSKSHLESHMPFNYPSEGAVTTTQAMLVPYRQRIHRPSEESLQQIKYSHLAPPWKGQRFFETEQQDKFTPKYRGPVTVCGGNFQVSSIPLGTLKMYSPQRQMVFAM